MTLDHAGRPARCGVLRANGGNVRPRWLPGRPRAAFDPRSCPPEPPRFRSLRPYPAGTGHGGRARQVAVIRCPRLADCPGPPLAGSEPRHAPIAGEETRKGRCRVADGRGEWRRPAAGCGPMALPAVVPTAGGTQAGAGAGDGAPRRIRGTRGRGSRPVPRPAAALPLARSRPVPVAALAGTTAGRAADPRMTANLSHPPRPAAALPWAKDRPVPVADSGRHHDGPRRRPAHDREPQPPTPASRLPQPALRFSSPSHGGADGVRSPLRAVLSEPATQAKTSGAREIRPPDRALRPICAIVLPFAPSGLTRGLRLAGRLFASGKKSISHACFSYMVRFIYSITERVAAPGDFPAERA